MPAPRIVARRKGRKRVDFKHRSASCLCLRGIARETSSEGTLSLSPDGFRTLFRPSEILLMLQGVIRSNERKTGRRSQVMDGEAD